MTAVLVTLALASLAAYVVVARAWRGLRDERDAAVRQGATLRSQRDAAEKRAKDAVADGARVRSLTLAGSRLSGDVVIAGRALPGDAEELTKLVRGLALIDDVILADPSGLSLSRESVAESGVLGALAPLAARSVAALRRCGFSPAQLTLETFEADRIVLRPLSGRMDRSWLVVRTTSEPVSQLVVDAVAHAAAREADLALAVAAPATQGLERSTDFVASTPVGAWLKAPMERALGVDQRALVVLEERTNLVSGAVDGPNVAVRAALADALALLAMEAGRTLRASTLARVEVLLDGGAVAAWSTFGPGARHALVSLSDRGVGSSAMLDRLLGTLRRGLDLRPAGTTAEAVSR